LTNKSYQRIVKHHIVTLKLTVLNRQAILDTVSSNESSMGWFSKVSIFLKKRQQSEGYADIHLLSTRNVTYQELAKSKIHG
jgi:hypothetical protein